MALRLRSSELRAIRRRWLGHGYTLERDCHVTVGFQGRAGGHFLRLSEKAERHLKMEEEMEKEKKRRK